MLQTLPVRPESRCRARELTDDAPAVDIVVPFHNEENLLPAKLANLQRLDYPRHRLRFIFVDGQSTDRSPEIASQAAGCDSRFVVLRSPVADKTQQINLALMACRAPWVMVTDVDAHLPKLAVRKLVAAAVSDGRIVLAGALHRPRRAIRFEQLHWRAWNASRLWEIRTGSISAALAPCYLMRRDWITPFPSNVIADDIYVSFAALASGRRIALTRTLVIERRAPNRMEAVLFHKLRKGRAFLREVIRFLPCARRMPSPMRELFLWRAAATLLAPPVILGIAAASLAFVPQAAWLWGFALICCLLPRGAFPSSHVGRRVLDAGGLVGLAFGLACVLCAALVSLPFIRQDACFSRWRQEEQ